MTDQGQSFYRGRQTQAILESIDAHPDLESAEPYRAIMRECGTGLPMPDDTTPWSKLGPAAWVMFAVILALPFGMMLGAGAKACPADSAVSP